MIIPAEPVSFILEDWLCDFREEFWQDKSGDSNPGSNLWALNSSLCESSVGPSGPDHPVKPINYGKECIS